MYPGAIGVAIAARFRHEGRQGFNRAILRAGLGMAAAFSIILIVMLIASGRPQKIEPVPAKIDASGAVVCTFKVDSGSHMPTMARLHRVQAGALLCVPE